jgi:hypothetical protein
MESRSPSASQRIHLLRTAFPVLPSLIDERPGNELNRVDLADRETVLPCLAFAAETPDSGAASVPLWDVDAVRAALAEEDDGHGELLYMWANKTHNYARILSFAVDPVSARSISSLGYGKSSTNGFLTAGETFTTTCSRVS